MHPEWVTKAELIANIPPEGIKLSDLLLRFFGRVKEKQEFIDWVADEVIFDRSTKLLHRKE